MTIQKSKPMCRKLALLLGGLVLLGGCAGEQQAEDDTPAAVSPELPAQVESVPASPLMETTPEELLAQQPVDDDHDAFLVDTGGRMGTLLVTVERGEQDVEHWEYPVWFTIWDPADMNRPIQEIEKTTLNTFHLHEEIDANFDGYTDFTYMNALGVQASVSYLWLWDEVTGQFLEEPEYGMISSPQINPETQVIDGWNRSSAAGDGVTTFHRWEDGRLVCVRRIELIMKDYCDDNSPWLLTVQDRISGNLIEVFRMECPLDSDDCFSTRMDWENLDYHGEPGGIYNIFQQQTIDDTHDVFLVDTRGRLGTVLVTVEQKEGTTPEGFKCPLFAFSVWSGGDLAQPIQTFEEIGYVFTPYYNLIDANFDGYMDFTLCLDHGAANGTFTLYVWEEGQEQFVPKGDFWGGVQIAQEETKTILNHIHGSAFSGTDAVYRWEDGDLVCVRWVVEEYPEAESQDLIVYELVDGEMKEIFRKTFAFESEGDGSPIYDEAALWYDLSYYGEP